jgi:hypothetical protein
MTLLPGMSRCLAGTKGKPEGNAVKSLTGKPWVAQTCSQEKAAGQNNSNPTPLAASVVNGEWELLLGIVPIIVL